jgi:hypothetical protein
MSLSHFIKLALAIAPLLVIALTGCGGKATPPKPANNAEKEHEHAHAHPTEGPHKGHLIELGEEEYHAELVHDDATKTISVYILDKNVEKAVPIAATELMLNLVVDGKPQQVKLVAAPQAGEPEGQSSLFTATDEAALEALEAPKTTGRLNVKIGEKTYNGAIEHHDHAH